MKRLGLGIVAIVFAVILYRPATSQDNYEERIEDLETRVTILEMGGGGALAPTAEAETYKLTGRLLLTGGNRDVGFASELPDRLKTEGEECDGNGGYSDLSVGADVTVRGSDGDVVGTGEVVSSEAVKQSNASVRQCRFNFVVENLPRSEFYSVEVAHRGEVTYSFEDLEEAGWKASMSIG